MNKTNIKNLSNNEENKSFVSDGLEDSKTAGNVSPLCSFKGDESFDIDDVIMTALDTETIDFFLDLMQDGFDLSKFKKEIGGFIVESKESLEKAIKAGVDIVNWRYVDGTNLLHQASVYSSLGVISMLIKYGVDVNAQDMNGDTPLHIAARCSSQSALRELLSNKANLNIRDKQGWRPQDHALYYKCLSNYHLLVQARETGAKVIDSHILRKACKCGDKVLIEDVFFHPNERKEFKNENDLVGYRLKYDLPEDWTKFNYAASCLCFAAQVGCADIVELLLRKTTPCIEDWWKNTPLMWAISNHHIDVVKILLNDERTDVNYCDRKDSSPLFRAVIQNDVEIVKLLLKDKRTRVVNKKEILEYASDDIAGLLRRVKETLPQKIDYSEHIKFESDKLKWLSEKPTKTPEEWKEDTKKEMEKIRREIRDSERDLLLHEEYRVRHEEVILRQREMDIRLIKVAKAERQLGIQRD